MADSFPTGMNDLRRPSMTSRSALFDDVPVKRGKFEEQLYRAAQAAGPADRTVDELLAAHRAQFGEPEQVAYANQVDPCDPRWSPPDTSASLERLVQRYGPAEGEHMHDYLKEHDQWRRRPSQSL